jgi:hypothetical protein
MMDRQLTHGIVTVLLLAVVWQVGWSTQLVAILVLWHDAVTKNHPNFRPQLGRLVS